MFLLLSYTLANTNEQLAAKIIEGPLKQIKMSVGADIFINCSVIGAANSLKLKWKMFKQNSLSVILTQKPDTIITQTFKYFTNNKISIFIFK